MKIKCPAVLSMTPTAPFQFTPKTPEIPICKAPKLLLVWRPIKRNGSLKK